MRKEIIDIIIFWMIVFIVPVFAVWTIGIPVMDEIFWFSEYSFATVIFWFWLSGVIVLGVVVNSKEIKDID